MLADFMEMPLPVSGKDSGVYRRGRAVVRFSCHFPVERRNFVLENVSLVIEYFPEYWDKVIVIGLECAFAETGYGGHFISVDDQCVRVRLVSDADVWLIAHEFEHGIQRIDPSVPRGEKSCDLFALARSTMYLNRPPSYLKLPEIVKSSWMDWIDTCHNVAKLAIKERKKGRRQYIKWFEDKIRLITVGQTTLDQIKRYVDGQGEK